MSVYRSNVEFPLLFKKLCHLLVCALTLPDLGKSCCSYERRTDNSGYQTCQFVEVHGLVINGVSFSGPQFID